MLGRLRTKLAAALLAAFAWTAATPAWPQACNFTFDNLDFGPIDLTSGTNFRITGNLTATCTGTPGRRIRICPNIGSGTGGNAAGGDPRYLLNGANQLQFNLFRNNAYTRVWGSYFWGQPPTPPQPRLRLDATGNGTRVRPIRAEIYAGQTTLPGGTYSSSFAGVHTLVAYAYNSVGNCAAIGAMNGVNVPFTVSATNIGSCTVSATSLDFGAVGLLSANVDTASTVSVTCTINVPYNVGLDDGGTGTGPTARLMVNAGEDVAYGIYQDAARTNAWGDTIGTNTVAGTGTGAVQSYTAYGRAPVQTTPTPATYSDTVVMTVTY